MAQMLLIPDPKPLDKRLGKKFFKKAPRRPGVYLMKNAQNEVVYVGKAKDLKQRLANYRLANPDRMPRRHLRMVREVTKIDFQCCPSEAAALKTEKKLIRELKPKFNRAGVWQGKPKFLVWRTEATSLELTVVETPLIGWQRFGPLGGGAGYLQRSLAKLLWLALYPQKAVTEMPTGWMRGEQMELVRLECGSLVNEIQQSFEKYFYGSPDEFLLWLGGQFTHRLSAFERQLIQPELESLQEFAERKLVGQKQREQLTLI